MSFLIRNDGNIVKVDFKSKTINEVKLNLIEANEQIVKTKVLANNTAIVIETNKKKLIYISANDYLENPSILNTKDYLNVKIISNVVTYSVNTHQIIYQTKLNKVGIIGNNLNPIYQRFINDHFSKNVQNIGLNNRFVFGKTANQSYIFSRIINSRSNIQGEKAELLNFKDILNVYSNAYSILLEKTDGTFHYLNNENQLTTIPIEFKVDQIFSINDRGFLIKSKENDFIFIENTIPNYSSMSMVYNIKIQKNWKKIAKFYPSENNMLIQYEDGTFESLLSFNQFDLLYRPEKYEQYKYYLHDLSKINFHIEESVLRENR